jgi:hypothetical protein
MSFLLNAVALATLSFGVHAAAAMTFLSTSIRKLAQAGVSYDGART